MESRWVLLAGRAHEQPAIGEVPTLCGTGQCRGGSCLKDGVNTGAGDPFGWFRKETESSDWVLGGSSSISSFLRCSVAHRELASLSLRMLRIFSRRPGLHEKVVL